MPVASWVEEALAPHLPSGGTVLEVGCADGRRLAALGSLRPDLSRLAGVDPSASAIATGREFWPDLDLSVGTAAGLDQIDGTFDVILFGFCLYLCDRNDLFTVADGAHRRIAADGAIAVLDFDPPSPARRPYHHDTRIWSYKADYSKLWTGNPEYCEVERMSEWSHGVEGRRSAFDRISLIILRRTPTAYCDYSS
jgi:SAM-dependent methyltransferase